ncbi:MAG: reverse gyrase [Candidatus Methanomethylicota archaeon]|uniref:Reverse gyrase n=1 Tax=Thermoproteota archaeon TaxID=2056631 RepID=A0A520KFF5_9CREN|nr:MAG: reverse gyrase [Candidatus Verstraetearchaeota archaeon]TDA40211.1 MAG: reverse gyrase [Candidatus Verstraetearchaeota archaeon]
MKAIYNGLCLNCNGEISSERLFQSGICEKCIDSDIKDRKKILKILKENGKILYAEKIFNFYENFQNFSLFFKKVLKQKMFSLQEMWAKRVLSNKCFSIVAPTGVGKTVFGIISALYFANIGKKSYIIVPTTLLVQQIVEKIQIFSSNIGKNFNIVYYHGLLGDKEKKEAIKKILEGNFDILITTDRFIITKSEELKGIKFDFVFVDDVDSFLKSPKNIDKILLLLGFDLDIINLSMRLLETKDIEEKEKIREKIREYKNNNKIGILVVSGATLKAKRTKRIRLFEELLDFQVGFKPEFVRNIKDVYIDKSKNIEEHVLDLIKEFGSGALVFVPQSLGKEFADYINEYLLSNGIKSYVYKKPEENILNDFQNGKYDVLIGIASFRNPLARGIDLPERVRYVIFAGVPRMEFKLSWEEYHPTKLLTILKNIRPFIKDELNANRIINNLNKIIPMKAELIEKIKEAIETNKKLEGFEAYAKDVIIEAREFLSKNITPELIELISKSKEIAIEKRENYFYLIISDAIGYIQASGRCSRMFAGGVSRGISFVIKDDEKAFYSLGQKLNIILGEFSWSKFNLERIKKWFKKIDEDREIIKNIREGKIIGKFKDYIKPVLLIVESPTKAKTISKFFGKPFKRKIGDTTIFEINTGKFVLNIVASMGHVFDLITDKGFHGVKINEEFIPIYDVIKKCKNCGNQFTGEICPKCKSKDYYSKEGFIRAIRELASEVKYVFLATDPDAEGEKISYDLFCIIHPINNKIERLEFHEVTKTAFIKALENRRKIDLRLVESQLVRRIEDRWIGFELSQVLWNVFKNRRLSAGRVQTPVLGWIIERVKEARKHKKVLYLVLSNDLKISIENPKEVKVNKAIISNLTEEEKVIYPAPPYTTDSLLRDASLELNFPVEKTMRIAQDLFEAGLCTYHRTDSTTVSNVGINIAKEYIQEKFPSLFVPRKYQKEGAHECIRPTRVIDVERLKYLIQTGILRLPIKFTSDHFKLYDLIFRRFIASQMKEVLVKYQKFEVKVNGNEKIMENPIEIVKEGFNKIIPIKLYDRVKEGEYEIKYSKLLRVPVVKLFTQGEVIAMMKERGIGRPSTYAKIISTLLERGYVFEVRNKLINTTLGLKVYSYLSEKFGTFVSEETTRRLEELMDKVAEGEVKYQEVLRNIYNEILTIRGKV